MRMASAYRVLEKTSAGEELTSADGSWGVDRTCRALLCWRQTVGVRMA
jgi:hypothetical protein